MPDEPTFELSLDLNVLNHLGLNLYSNVPAVLAEVVANSWDADATQVIIEIDPEESTVIITDDGHGMTVEDINAKYLAVGYERRKDPDGGAVTKRFKRAVMGRKGIGKLSLFSIANQIEVHSAKAGQVCGFRMITQDIRDHIDAKKKEPYRPAAVPQEDIVITKGTRLILTDLKKQVSQAESGLRKRLARRFSILGAKYEFAITLGGTEITLADRDYFHKLQYLWEYGGPDEERKALCKNLEKSAVRPGKIQGTSFEVSGWIGTPKSVGGLKDEYDNINKIVIMVRGKLAQEDIIEEFGEGGLYSKYLIGEIHADFLDLDDEEDIATSSRQRIIEDADRYKALKAFVGLELKNIQSTWTKWRNEDGAKRAQEIPAIKAWFGELSKDNKKLAVSLFGKINQLTFESESDRRQILKNSVLAFESLRYKKNLLALETISPENLQAIGEIFASLDDIEATLYHQIVKERIGIIEALQQKVANAALEKVVQEHVFTHLWLLDPSWERATETPYMEQNVKTEFDKIDVGLTDEERAGRVDIKYTTTPGKHVIVELKRSDRVVSTTELMEQTGKYRDALRKLLDAAGKANEPIEVVCVVGRELKDWPKRNGREESHKILAAVDTRVVMYQELLENAQKAYKQFLEKHVEAGRVSRLIAEIEEWKSDGE